MNEQGMNFYLTKMAGDMINVSFFISTHDWEEALQDAYLKSKEEIPIPGFKKGKVPRRMIEKFYGEDFFYSDAFEIILKKIIEE